MMTVLKSVRSKKFLAALSVLVSVAAMLVGAHVASADEVWFQSYQRGSASEACVAQAGETPWQDSWGPNPGWSPSWEQWANNGQGGWVCSRSITWARDSAARIYNVGDIGPGGGTVFYVDMARAAGSQFWEVGSDLGSAEWCGDSPAILIGGIGIGIGTGEANTAAIISGCATPVIAARVASAPAGGYSDWFLPSKDELNQLCKYARTQSTAVADQAVICNSTGTLRSGFATGDYWTSSQVDADAAWNQWFETDPYTGDQTSGIKPVPAYFRAVRAF